MEGSVWGKAMLDAYFNANEIADVVLSCIQHTIMVTDLEGQILFASPGTKTVLGFAPAELEGQNLSLIFTPEDMTYFYRNLFSLVRDQKGFEGQVMLMRKDRKRFFAFMVIRPGPDPSADKNIVLVCLQDIDREKRIEETMRKNQYEDLVKIARGVAHELRNPLVSIGGFINRLYKSCRSVDEHDRYYKFILADLRKVERLVNKVDAFTMVQKPRLVLESMKTIVERAVAMHAEDFKKRAIQVDLEVEDTALRVDQTLVVKALFVILENALDALPESGRICVSCTGGETEYRISVTDNGCGIDPKDLPFVFNPFFSTKADGAGMDLATVKRIMDSLSGRIEVTSTKGKGTTFVLVFPIERRRAIRIAPFNEEGCQTVDTMKGSTMVR
jgi:PAS domain S-box-containing protein